MTKRDEWMRVESEEELQAGMCVELRPNFVTGKKARFMLLRRNTDLAECVSFSPVRESARSHRCRAWKTADGEMACVVDAIPEGRLFRLSDSQLTDSEETRELERAR